MKSLICAAIFAIAPGLALAGPCGGDHARQEAMSCAEGMIWSPELGLCVPLDTS